MPCKHRSETLPVCKLEGALGPGSGGSLGMSERGAGLAGGEAYVGAEMSQAREGTLWPCPGDWA